MFAAPAFLHKAFLSTSYIYKKPLAHFWFVFFAAPCCRKNEVSKFRINRIAEVLTYLTISLRGQAYSLACIMKNKPKCWKIHHTLSVVPYQ